MSIFDTRDQTRRTFVKTVAYVAPAVLTLKATPALAQHASHPPVVDPHTPVLTPTPKPLE